MSSCNRIRPERKGDEEEQSQREIKNERERERERSLVTLLLTKSERN